MFDRNTYQREYMRKRRGQSFYRVRKDRLDMLLSQQADPKGLIDWLCGFKDDRPSPGTK